MCYDTDYYIDTTRLAFTELDMPCASIVGFCVVVAPVATAFAEELEPKYMAPMESTRIIGSNNTFRLVKSHMLIGQALIFVLPVEGDNNSNLEKFLAKLDVTTIIIGFRICRPKYCECVLDGVASMNCYCTL